MESKSGNDFVKTKNIENVLHCKNITDNKKIRKGKNKTYGDVVSSELDLSTRGGI